MKSISYPLLPIIFITILSTHNLCSKQEPKDTRENESALYADHKPAPADNDRLNDKQGFRPNPVILAGVGEIMNGALSIAQDPHSRPNIGHSVAGMLHGIMTIIVEKIAHKRGYLNEIALIQDCFAELSQEINEEITRLQEITYEENENHNE